MSPVSQTFPLYWYIPENAALGLPNVSVIAPAAILAVTEPEKMLVKLIVNVVVMFPFDKLTFVTVPATPLMVRSLA